MSIPPITGSLRRRVPPCPVRSQLHTVGSRSGTSLQTRKFPPPVKPLMSLLLIPGSFLGLKAGRVQALQGRWVQPNGGLSLSFQLPGLSTALHPSRNSCLTQNNLKPSCGHRELGWCKLSIPKKAEEESREHRTGPPEAPQCLAGRLGARPWSGSPGGEQRGKNAES